MRPMRVLKYLWVLPTSSLGLLLVPDALFTGKVRWVDGVLEVHGRMARFVLEHITPFAQGACAMTLGHVVIARNAKLLDDTREHERVHVRQCERWGPLFIPAYLLASFLAWRRGQNAYEDNSFEREAFDTAG
jgi:hypothetical protein